MATRISNYNDGKGIMQLYAGVCPRCASPPGYFCETTSGKRTNIHFDRIDSADRKANPNFDEDQLAELAG
jgi:hypothetical protein